MASKVEFEYEKEARERVSLLFSPDITIHTSNYIAILSQKFQKMIKMRFSALTTFYFEKLTMQNTIVDDV